MYKSGPAAARWIKNWQIAKHIKIFGRISYIQCVVQKRRAAARLERSA